MSDNAAAAESPGTLGNLEKLNSLAKPDTSAKSDSSSPPAEEVENLDQAAVFQEVLASAEQGDATAQNCVGQMYAAGTGVERDYPHAVTWFHKAAEQGHMGAQYNLGVSYANGLGVERDDAQAVEWFGKAALQGSNGAEYNLQILLARNFRR